MSEPSPEYGPDFWVKACGGKYLVTAKIGVHWTLAELIYDKYCRPGKVPREHLYYVLAWLKLVLTTLIIRTIVVLIFRTRMVVGILSQFLYFLVHTCINRSTNTRL